MNIALKTAILETGKYQIEIAGMAGLSEVRLSRIVRKKGLNPTEEEKIKLSNVLNKPIEEIFPDDTERT